MTEGAYEGGTTIILIWVRSVSLDSWFFYGFFVMIDDLFEAQPIEVN